MPFSIVRNDITKMVVDAIVNAANTELKQGGGVCGAIFAAAGAEKLQRECDKIGKCNVGDAVITPGFGLPAKYIIHTVGPIWCGGGLNEAQHLHDCYIHSLQLALTYSCESVAFPLISSGIYGYPKDRALQIAVSAISEFLLSHDMMVYLVVYDKASFALGEKLFSDIEKYIDDNYVEAHAIRHGNRQLEPYEFQQLKDVQAVILAEEEWAPLPTLKVKPSLVDVIKQLDETFSEALLRLIDEKGMTDVEAYRRANIDRKLFSKIRSDKNYRPGKGTAIAFAIALGLNLDEALDLLGKAGFTLSHSNKFDVIIEYFIEQGMYDINEINQALFAFDQTQLGA